MACGHGLIDLRILAKEDKNECHSALIAAAFAKSLASVTPIFQGTCTVTVYFVEKEPGFVEPGHFRRQALLEDNHPVWLSRV
jgi:hypothetical protein